MSTINSRRPRFRREEDALPPLQITTRDLQILHRLAAHRFLRSSQIAALVGGSARQVVHRLKLLYHHGYVERPRAQLDYFQRGGSKELVYGLASRGAGRLRRDLNLFFSRMDWTTKNRRATRLFLEHALMVSDIMTALELACRKLSGIRFLSREDIILPASAQTIREPFHWNVHVSTLHRVGIIPDAVFGLEYGNAPEGRNRAWFFVEADRGTMPVIRENLDQTSFFRKMLAYEATWTQSLHRSRLGLSRFRVLTVTSSAERVSHLLNVSRRMQRGRGLFLFREQHDFAANPDPLSLLQ